MNLYGVSGIYSSTIYLPLGVNKEMKQRAGFTLGSVDGFILGSPNNISSRVYYVNFRNGTKAYWRQYLDAKDYFDLQVIQARDKLTKEERLYLNELLSRAIL